MNYPGGPGAPASPLVSSPGDSRAASPRARRRQSRDRSPPLVPLPPPDALPHLTANFDNLTITEVHCCFVLFFYFSKCVLLLAALLAFTASLVRGSGKLNENIYFALMWYTLNECHKVCIYISKKLTKTKTWYWRHGTWRKNGIPLWVLHCWNPKNTLFKKFFFLIRMCVTIIIKINVKNILNFMWTYPNFKK